MTRWAHAAAATVAVIAGGCMETEQGQTQANPEPAGLDWQDEYDEMVSVLALTADEQTRLRAAFEARESTLRAWLDGAEGQALYEEERALREATEERDLAAVRAITRQDTTQRDRFRALVEKTQRDIIQTLPPDKQRLWQGHRIARELLGHMATLNLTPTQEQSIRSNAVAAIDAARRAGEPNPLAAGYLELERWAETNALTPAQRRAYQDVKEREPLRSLSF